MQPNKTLPVSPASLSAAPAPVPAVTAIPSTAASLSISGDLHYVLSQVFTHANLEFLKIMIIGAGAAAGKKAVELFVEQAKTWFSNKRSIEGFDITPPPGMTIDSLKMEGKKAVITLKADTAPLAPALAMPVASSLISPAAASLPTPVSVSTEVSSLKKKKRKK